MLSVPGSLMAVEKEKGGGLLRKIIMPLYRALQPRDDDAERMRKVSARIVLLGGFV